MTVEAAVALLGLALVLVSLVWFLVVISSELRVQEAARAGARLAARTQPDADVRAEVHRIAPGSWVEVSASGDRVVVRVRQRVTAPLGPLSGVGSFDVSTEATALREQS